LRSVVLLSAGLDSSVGLAWAVEQGEVALALTFDYGQRSAAQEVRHARELALRFGVPHRVVELPFLAEITDTALVNRDAAVPEPRTEALDAPAATQTARAVWVPNRNGVFVNVAGAFAEALGAEQVVAGFNAEEGSTFPDNSVAYVTAADAALTLSTWQGVRLVAPLSGMRKDRIVELALARGIGMGSLWSCYHGGERMCGRCESCRRLRRALEECGRGELWSGETG
jgi:7-cyano-7-deazaguanine synthase